MRSNGEERKSSSSSVASPTIFNNNNNPTTPKENVPAQGWFSWGGKKPVKDDGEDSGVPVPDPNAKGSWFWGGKNVNNVTNTNTSATSDTLDDEQVPSPTTSSSSTTTSFLPEAPTASTTSTSTSTNIENDSNVHEDEKIHSNPTQQPTSWLGLAGNVAGTVVGGVTTVAGSTAGVATRIVTGTVAGGVVAGIPGAVGGLASGAVSGAVTVGVGAVKLGVSGISIVGGGAMNLAGAAARKVNHSGEAIVSVNGNDEGFKGHTDKPQCSECAVLFSYRCWKYDCPCCQKPFCGTCLSNTLKHRVPKMKIFEPVAVCRDCFVDICSQGCGGKCFYDWPVADLKKFMEKEGIECTGIEKFDLVKTICNFGCRNK